MPALFLGLEESKAAFTVDCDLLAAVSGLCPLEASVCEMLLVENLSARGATYVVREWEKMALDA